MTNDCDNISKLSNPLDHGPARADDSFPCCRINPASKTFTESLNTLRKPSPTTTYA
jgi:hypothetical protein